MKSSDGDATTAGQLEKISSLENRLHDAKNAIKSSELAVIKLLEQLSPSLKSLVLLIAKMKKFLQRK